MEVLRKRRLRTCIGKAHGQIIISKQLSADVAFCRVICLTETWPEKPGITSAWFLAYSFLFSLVLRVYFVGIFIDLLHNSLLLLIGNNWRLSHSFCT